MAMKYKVTVVAVMIVAAIFLSDGYLRTRHADHKTSMLKSTISALSIQQLAQASQECDSAQSSGGRAKHDTAYCAEVYRVIEAEPLQIVEAPPSPAK
jgi:hypothetical protein